VQSIKLDNNLFIINTLKDSFSAKQCIISTGKYSSELLLKLCNNLKLSRIEMKAKIGVRAEIPANKINNLENIFKANYKVYHCDDMRINSFVGEWEESNLLSAFGYNSPKEISKRTNFMINIEPSESYEEILKYIQIINILTNEKIKKERIEDFVNGKSILNNLKIFDNLKIIFSQIEKILPMFISYAIMYVPEIKLQGILSVNENMETNIPNLYAIGECTSKTNTLLGAMASGIISARLIGRKNEKKN
jgi:uncharacterized FAD-dependent dehydrogenase